MNVKRFILSFLAVFVFIFLFEGLFHGKLLHDLYAQTQSLWRTEQEMNAYFHWLVLGHVIIALFFSLIFVKCCQSSGIGPGLGFGLLMGLLSWGETLITYTVQPLPPKLVMMWLINGLVEFGIAGIVLGAIYRPRSGAPPASA